jgi:type II secretory pathway component PulL
MRNGEWTILQRKRSLVAQTRSALPGTEEVRGHWAGEVVALVLVAIGGAAVAAWRANQRGEDALNARTWARLLPPHERVPDESGAE